MKQPTVTEVLSLQEVALRCSVDVSFVERLVELGVIEAQSDDAQGPARERFKYSREVTLRVQRCVRLHQDLGVNPEGAAVILELLGRIEALEHELRAMRQR